MLTFDIVDSLIFIECIYQSSLHFNITPVKYTYSGSYFFTVEENVYIMAVNEISNLLEKYLNHCFKHCKLLSKIY